MLLDCSMSVSKSRNRITDSLRFLMPSRTAEIADDRSRGCKKHFRVTLVSHLFCGAINRQGHGSLRHSYQHIYHCNMSDIVIREVAHGLVTFSRCVVPASFS